jgi:hypothetical protein
MKGTTTKTFLGPSPKLKYWIRTDEDPSPTFGPRTSIVGLPMPMVEPWRIPTSTRDSG